VIATFNVVCVGVFTVGALGVFARVYFVWAVLVAVKSPSWFRACALKLYCTFGVRLDDV
jgi:hypothetical protein